MFFGILFISLRGNGRFWKDSRQRSVVGVSKVFLLLCVVASRVLSSETNETLLDEKGSCGQEDESQQVVVEFSSNQVENGKILFVCYGVLCDHMFFFYFQNT